MKRFEGKTVIVTGGGRGIGAACARLFASEGARVVLAARTVQELDQTAFEIEKNMGQGKVLAIPTDVSDEGAVIRLFETSKKNFGLVDILINNAAILYRAGVLDQTTEEWDRVVAVNLRGPFLCSREAFRQMKESRRGGAIVNVSSLSGIRGVEKFPGMSSYIATKHALVGLTEALAVEGKEWGIRVNGIAPGAVDTRMFRENSPVTKVETKPEDIAPSILFLCDEKDSSPLSGAVLEIFC